MKSLKNPKVLFFSFTIVTLLFMLAYNLLTPNIRQDISSDINTQNPIFPTTPISKVTPTPSTLVLKTPQIKKILLTDYHVFQSFNNCGPAALSMALKFYDIEKSQFELGQSLRPWQNPEGINDDKSVTLEELASESEKYGFIPYHRPNGNIEKIKLFITYDMPVITRTWFTVNEDIGHYRVVKGYDENSGELIQDDSLENKNLWYTYQNFNQIWKKFNYEYLVLVPVSKKEIADAILGPESDPKFAWQKAVEASQNELNQNQNDITARFNLSVAYYNVGNYQKSAEEYEKIESQLPFRTLWYQIEPIKAYYELGNHDRVIAITDHILNNQNLAYEQAYLIRGKSYQKKGQTDLARAEFEKAVFYNSNLQEAKTALSSLQ